jgi:hypothetical protein
MTSSSSPVTELPHEKCWANILDAFFKSIPACVTVGCIHTQQDKQTVAGGGGGGGSVTVAVQSKTSPIHANAVKNVIRTSTIRTDSSVVH